MSIYATISMSDNAYMLTILACWDKINSWGLVIRIILMGQDFILRSQYLVCDCIKSGPDLHHILHSFTKVAKNCILITRVNS